MFIIDIISFKKEPWEYCDNALITLCQSCHKMVHDTLPSLVYTQKGSVLRPMNFTPCTRCNGYGYLSEYKYIQNGICFRCRGLKYEELITKSFNSVDEYIDNNSKVYDSIESNDVNEAVDIFQKGKSLHIEGKLKEAKEYYLRAALLGYGKAQNNIGLLLEDEGDFVGAKRWLLYSAMQGIEQAKNNIINLFRKIDKTNPVFNNWCNIVRDKKEIQCQEAFLTIARFLDEKTEEYNMPPLMSVLESMATIIEFANEGHELATRILDKYKIKDVFDEFMTKFLNGDIEEE